MKFIFCFVFAVGAARFSAVAGEEQLLRGLRQLQADDVTTVEKPKISYLKEMFCNINYQIGLKAKYRVTNPTMEDAKYEVYTILKDDRDHKIDAKDTYTLGAGKSKDILVSMFLTIAYTKPGNVKYHSETIITDLTTGKRKQILKSVDPLIVCK